MVATLYHSTWWALGITGQRLTSKRRDWSSYCSHPRTTTPNEVRRTWCLFFSLFLSLLQLSWVSTRATSWPSSQLSLDLSSPRGLYDVRRMLVYALGLCVWYSHSRRPIRTWSPCRRWLPYTSCHQSSTEWVSLPLFGSQKKDVAHNHYSVTLTSLFLRGLPLSDRPYLGAFTMMCFWPLSLRGGFPYSFFLSTVCPIRQFSTDV